MIGSGKAKALRDKVQGRIDDGTLFPNIISSLSKGMMDASKKMFDEMDKRLTDDVITPIIGEIHSVYSTITPAKKPSNKCEGQTLEETQSLELLQAQCRWLDGRYQFVISHID